MSVVGNFYFFRLMWEFLDLESECGGSVCWPNNKIIDYIYFGPSDRNSLAWSLNLSHALINRPPTPLTTKRRTPEMYTYISLNLLIDAQGPNQSFGFS